MDRSLPVAFEYAMRFPSGDTRGVCQTGRQIRRSMPPLIDEGEATPGEAGAGGGVNQQSGIRDIEMRRAGIDVPECGSQHALDHGNGIAFGLQPVEIKRDGKKDALVGVEQMPCWQVSGVAAALMIVFRAPPASGCTTMRALSDRSSPPSDAIVKSTAWPPGSICGPSRYRRSHGDQRLRLAAGGDLFDAVSALAEEIVSPCQLSGDQSEPLDGPPYAETGE